MQKSIKLQETVNLAIVVAITFAIRLINYVGPVRGDDFQYLSAAHDLQFGSVDIHAWFGLDRVAIYYPISYIYRVFGISPETSIAYPLFCSLATVVIIFYIGKLLKGSSTGFAAALLWAVFPLDVLNATQVLPDSIVSAFVAGSILLLLLGIQNAGWRRYSLWAGMYLLLYASLFIKDASLINLVFCTFMVVIIVFGKKISNAIKKLKIRLERNQAILLFLFVSSLLISLPWERIIVFPKSDPITAFGQNASDFFQALFLGLPSFGYEQEIMGRVALFDIFVLFFLVALISLVAKGERKLWFPISWLAAYLLLSEWGAQRIGFPTLYSPPNPELILDRRHILFVMIPMLIIVGMYLSSAFESKLRPKLIFLLISLSSASIFLNRSLMNAGSVQWMQNIYASAILAALISPISIFSTLSESRKKNWMIAISALLLFASLMPIRRYHSNDWQKEKALIENLTDAAEYLFETNPQVPIITIPGNNTKLNYASNFQLGYNWGSIEHVFADARIQNLNSEESESLEIYIVFEDLNKESHYALIAQDWVSVAEFEQEGLSRVIVFHHLP